VGASKSIRFDWFCPTSPRFRRVSPYLKTHSMYASKAPCATGRDSVSTLRYKALNSESYRLDSPPFTGAAVTGGGPVTKELGQDGSNPNVYV